MYPLPSNPNVQPINIISIATNPLDYHLPSYRSQNMPRVRNHKTLLEARRIIASQSPETLANLQSSTSAFYTWWKANRGDDFPASIMNGKWMDSCPHTLDASKQYSTD